MAVPSAVKRLVARVRSVPAGEAPAVIAGAVRVQARNGALSALHASGLHRHAGRPGRGVILCWHEVHDDVGPELMVGTDVRRLEAAVAWLRREGRDIVTLDEAARRLGDPASRPFAVLTFDDGYRDLATRVLPVMERHDAPFTTYVPTAMITRELDAWWLGLRELFRRHDSVDFAPMGRRFACADHAAKVVALATANAWVGADLRRVRDVGPVLRAHGVAIRDLVAAAGLDAEGLRALARSPLVTVGAHTDSHAALATLDEDWSRGEMARNKAFLEDLLDRPVRHIAYPYGSAVACGPREARLAEGLGFRTGTTTAAGTVDAADAARLLALPREDVGYPAIDDVRLACHVYGTLHGPIGRLLG